MLNKKLTGQIQQFLNVKKQIGSRCHEYFRSKLNIAEAMPVDYKANNSDELRLYFNVILIINHNLNLFYLYRQI
jgi:hypothetical protein